MTLLGLVQQFCLRRGLPQPTAVITGQDELALQLVGLLNEILDDLVTRHTWQELDFQCDFTSVAGEDQGAISSLVPHEVFKVLNDTIYDRTSRLPVFGPRSAMQWQQLKALPASGPFYQYRIQQGRLKIFPAMPAGHTMAFEYASKSPVLDADGVTYKQYFSADTDTCVLQGQLLLAGLHWVWKREKGFAYASEFADYEKLVADTFAGDGTKPRLNLAGSPNTIVPGIFVPAGDWPIPPYPGS